MRRRSLGPGFLLLLCSLCLQTGTRGQQNAMGLHAGAQGRLTVTATVVTSVGLVTGPDGEQHIVIANAADPADNVSKLQPVVAVNLTPSPEAAAKPQTKKPGRQKN